LSSSQPIFPAWKPPGSEWNKNAPAIKHDFWFAVILASLCPFGGAIAFEDEFGEAFSSSCLGFGFLAANVLLGRCISRLRNSISLPRPKLMLTIGTALISLGGVVAYASVAWVWMASKPDIIANLFALVLGNSLPIQALAGRKGLSSRKVPGHSPGMRSAIFPVLIITLLLFAGCLAESKLPNQVAERRASKAAAVGDFRPHVHDYWNGTALKPFLRHDINPRGSSGGSLEVGFSPEPGSTVVMGSSEIRFSFNLTVTGAESLSFSYGLRTRGAQNLTPIVPQQNLSIFLQPEQADFPHANISDWHFSIRLRSAAASGLRISGKVSADLVRGSDPLPQSPGHPEQWGGRMAAALFDQRGALQETFGLQTQAPPESLAIKAVPWSSLELVLRLNYSSPTPPQLHYAPKLEFKAANGFGPKESIPPGKSQPASGNGFYEWRIQLNSSMWDSPYASESKWDLRVDWAEPVPTVNLRPVFMKGEYQLAVHTTRSV
jgi:hypothetical protein